jgi:hypothetical protein
MRRVFLALLLGFAAWIAWNGIHEAALAQTPPTPRPAAPTATPAPAPIDTFAAQRDSMMNAVLATISGRENAPAESVFKNIKVMKGMPAGRLLRVMNIGYGRSLGVRCSHCHVADKWELEDRPQKQIARDMMALSRTLNEEMLPKISNLRSQKPTVNCTTCHRGSIKPALNL